MRPVWFVVVCSAVAVAAGPIHDLAAAPRPKPAKRGRSGKVVRVERNQPKVSSKARLCSLYDLEVATCTLEVTAGEVGLVLDAEGNYGEAAVMSASRVSDACGNTVSWNIEVDVSRLTSRDFSYNAVFVLDHPVAEGGHTLPASMDPPSGRPDENVQHVLDDDADGQPDLLLTTYACDERGQPTRASRVSHNCFDTWVELRDEWRHARTDQVATCYR